MKVDEIKQLVKIVEESDIADLEVTRWWGRKVKITKYGIGSSTNLSSQSGSFYTREPIYQHTVPVPPPPVPMMPPAAVNPPATVADSAPPTAEKQNYTEIKSPMVGTFYRSPAPDAEPYVNDGSVVSKGQVLCIIEAMKLMNEIEAEFPCKIVETLVQNAQPVEYNQPLFRVIKT